MTANSAPATAGSTIPLPDAPPIPGLRFRHYRGPEDHADLVRVANAQSAAIGESRVKSVEELDNEFAHPVNMDPYRDVVVAEVDGRVVGWGRVDWVDQNWGGRSYDSWAPWTRPGSAAASAGRCCATTSAGIHEIGDADGYRGPRWLGTWGNDDNAALGALMDQEGYVPVRHFFLMVRPNLDDIDELPLPDGIEVRPIDDANVRQLYDADIDAFKDHWGGIEDSEETFRQWTEFARLRSLALFVVAWDGDEIAAGVVNGIYAEENERLGVKRGFLDQVFTRRAVAPTRHCAGADQPVAGGAAGPRHDQRRPSAWTPPTRTRHSRSTSRAASRPSNGTRRIASRGTRHMAANGKPWTSRRSSGVLRWTAAGEALQATISSQGSSRSIVVSWPCPGRTRSVRSSDAIRVSDSTICSSEPPGKSVRPQAPAEQGVAAEQEPLAARQQADRALRVAGRVQHVQGDAAEADLAAFGQVDGGNAGDQRERGRDGRTGMFQAVPVRDVDGQLGAGRLDHGRVVADVIPVPVRAHDQLERPAALRRGWP